ncbi:MAG: T9SS type A sorting domain-containing protein [Bacteroidota bacterium]
MKKLILPATLLLTTVASVFAQSPVFDYSPFGVPMNKPAKPSSQVRNKIDISTWYNHLDMISKSNIGASLQQYVAFMQHDSNALYIDATGERITGVGRVSIGQVLDPKDDLIDQTDDPASKLSKFVSYKMDSMRMAYLYVRNVDSLDDGIGGKLPVTDTLFISYFRGAQITKPSIVGNPTKIASIGWTGGNVRFPTNYLKTDTILLGAGKNDSTRVSNNNNGFENSWQVKTLQVPAPEGVSIDALNGANTNNLVAAAVTFKSGVRTVDNGDTAIMIYQQNPTTFPAGRRRTNYFGYYYASNQGTTDWSNPTYFNSSLIGIARAAYATFNGWNGYINGAAFINEQFVDMDFHLTSTSGNVGIADIKNDNFALSQVYPNPARSTDRPVIAFNLKQSATVHVSILNLVGQQVKPTFSKSYSDGAHAEFVDISGVKPGVYFVSMTVNGNTISKKLNITE